jgi:4-hydroxythreonine-4-phosphate dehydrogenase
VSSPVLAVTLGDPRGIGAELLHSTLPLLQAEAPGIRISLFGDAGALEREWPSGVERCPVGRFDGSLASAGRISADSIREGVALATSIPGGALVTAPVHKPALHEAGVRHPGQTEFLQELTGADIVGMLMVARTTRIGPLPLRILLATTHLPLREVPDRITAELLEAQITLLHRTLQERWGLSDPALGLCGLNPHASDGGLFGTEEGEIMAPLVKVLRARGMDLRGPLPADTVFLKAVEGELDAVVSPTHDVGMAVFKTLAFGRGVNVTLGLPFLRTSPDHGTAFDLVGTGRADQSSTLAALRLAAGL